MARYILPRQSLHLNHIHRYCCRSFCHSVSVSCSDGFPHHHTSPSKQIERRGERKDDKKLIVREKRERISNIYIIILLSDIFLLTSNNTAAVAAATTSSSAAVIVITLNPTDVVVSLSSLIWDETKNENDAKDVKTKKKWSETGG